MSSRIAQLREKYNLKFWRDDAEALLGVVVLLLIIGTVNVFSASFVYAETNFGTPYFFLKKQGINLVCGALFFLMGLLVPYRKWRDYTGAIFAGLMVLLVAVLVVGQEVNGARRWLSIGAFGFQPSEFAKIVGIFIMSTYVSDHIRKGIRCQLLSLPLFLLFLIFWVIEFEPDGATATACLMSPIVLLLLSNMKKETKLKLVGLSLAGMAGVVLLQPYRIQRFMSVLNPWAHAQGDGYQMVQSLSAIGSGGLTGMGLGMGISKYSYLPEAHTDFAFAIFSQENGFIGVCFVLLLFSALMFYGFRIAHNATEPLGKCLAFGLTFLLVMQALANLLMVAGLAPVIGVPLPFISYGGCSLFSSLWAVGIIMNIERSPRLPEGAEPEKRKTPPPPPERPQRRRAGRPYLHRVK